MKDGLRDPHLPGRRLNHRTNIVTLIRKNAATSIGRADHFWRTAISPAQCMLHPKYRVCGRKTAYATDFMAFLERSISLRLRLSCKL
jgi:hypothetical protein